MITLSEPNYQKIPKFTNVGSYHVDISWDYLEKWLDCGNDGPNYIDLDPDYQRGYVWTEAQQIAYVEYILRGGRMAKDIFFNCTTWNTDSNTPVEIVDGKQRVHAVLRFLRNEIPAFCYYRKEFSGYLRDLKYSFSVYINDLRTRKEVLQWYLEFNTGGTVHTEAELDRVRELIKQEEGLEK